MTMSNVLPHIFLLISGFFIGRLYFAFLWYQIQQMMQKANSLYWGIGGFTLRLLGVGLIFYLVLQQWGIEGLLFFLVGWMVSKLRTKQRIENEN